MAVSTLPDVIPPLRGGQLTYYSPTDIKRWGVQRFLDAVAPAEPVPVPDLGFTAEEDARMDALLREERANPAHGL